jgi:hypothetical protein
MVYNDPRRRTSFYAAWRKGVLFYFKEGLIN